MTQSVGGLKDGIHFILGRRRLADVPKTYNFSCFCDCRPHQGLGQRIRVATATKKFTEGATIESLPVLGGLHHDQQAAA